ncbi:MAG: sulfur transferase domain-containing protein [Byssovorax sp.]
MKLSRVTPRLYRSDQPTLDDLEELRSLGINTIINLRREAPELWRAERARALELGMRFYHFPFYGIFGARTALLDAILREIDRPDNGVVLVHCKNGQDRTSLVIGLYRVVHEGSTLEEAWGRDFVAYGHDPDNPPSVWVNRWANFFYRNIRRTFHRHAQKRAPRRRPGAGTL